MTFVRYALENLEYPISRARHSPIPTKDANPAKPFLRETNRMGDKISSPRPMFNINEVKKGVKRYSMGGTTAGVVLDVSEEGFSVNGYYQSFRTDTKLACLSSPVLISWSELDKIRKSVFEKPKRKKAKKGRKKKVKEIKPDRVDKPDEEYLDSLPIVTINGAKYYIDAEKQERRSVRNPGEVFNYGKKV